MKSAGAEMFGQSDHLFRACHYAQFTSLASFLIYFDSWHQTSLLDDSKDKDKFRAFKASLKQRLINLRNSVFKSKRICNFFHKLDPDSARPACYRPGEECLSTAQAGCSSIRGKVTKTNKRKNRRTIPAVLVIYEEI
jgi:hypothetical protein